MAAIQFTDRGVAARLSAESRTLARAASAALAAPSTLTVRPWRWRVDGPVLALRADPSRRDDRDGRRLAVDCGIALHHARTALAAGGVLADVRYLPDPDDPDLLATIGYAGRADAGPAEVRLYRAIAARGSDRRPIAPLPVPASTLDGLRRVAERPAVRVRLVAGDGPVPAARLVVHTADDRPEGLVGAGEAASAILLTATAEGLATELSRGPAGAVAAVRIGVPAPGGPPV